MTRHKWTHEGYTHNFCVKCGVKKGWARITKCLMSQKNWLKQLNHKVIFKYAGQDLSPYNNFYSCDVCKITNKRWGRYAIIWKHESDPIAYVPYREKEKDGKKIRRYCRLPKNKKPGDDILYWPIYCPYTEEEAIIKDIIE